MLSTTKMKGRERRLQCLRRHLTNAQTEGYFRKVLIANRGEIAIRIAKAAADLGIATVGIYAPEDATSLHLSFTNESVQIDSTGEQIPYLNIDSIIKIAKQNNCDCIHPGYGFLSENADFARRCEEENIQFIGPEPETLSLFGSKVKAKQLATSVGVPIIKGSKTALTNPEEALKFASQNLRFPVMLKASFGGGGKGMRVVEKAEDIMESFESCRREALSAFGNGSIFIEEFVENALHIEVQILADSQGNIIHLFERDCSIQLRNQKLIEIAPAPLLAENIRTAILSDAIEIAKASKYCNAGTVEFLVSPESNSYYFIECNPRIQVEHTVTEEVTGIDLVESQFLIAAGRSLKALGLTQEVVQVRGFAIQARVVANGFGTIQAYKEPSGAGVRVDACGYLGLTPSPRYDPLIAKVICSTNTPSFQKAVVRLKRAIQSFHIAGLSNNLSTIIRICDHEVFKNGMARTSFLAKFPDMLKQEPIENKTYALLNKTLEQLHSTDDDDSFLPSLPTTQVQTVVSCGLHATVVEYRIHKGQFVNKGDTILVVSAMKMETLITCPVSGVCTAIQENVKFGDALAPNDSIAVIDPSIEEADAEIRMVHVQKNEVTWAPEVEELRLRQEYVKQMGGDERIRKHKENGKNTVRERVAMLLDDMNSFNEIGSTVGRFTYDDKTGKLEGFVNPSNIVIGQGFVDGRPVCVSGDDFTVKGGSMEGSISAGTSYGDKRMMIERLSREMRIPIIRLIDGNSGGGSVNKYSGPKRTYIPEAVGYNQQILMLNEVPVVSVLLGSVVGIGAARACASHFNVIVRDKAQLMVAGPPVVIHATGEKLSKEELGGANIVTTTGAVDNIALDEMEAIRMSKRFLSYLPGSVFELPPVLPCTDPIDRRDERLLSIIPKKQRGTYDIREIITMTCDEHSWFEIGTNWAKNIVIGFARVNGHPIGLITSDCRFNGGCLDTPGSLKMKRFAQLLELFHVPVVMLVDMPGFEVGSNAERTAVIRHGVALMATLYTQTVPRYTIIIRRAFGVAGQAMAGSNEGRESGVSPRVAWPSGDWGSLPLEGGIEAANKRKIAEHPNPDLLRKEIYDRLSKYRSPFRTAEAFGIENIIDPRDTRPNLCAWVKLAYRVLNHGDKLRIRPGLFTP